MPQLGSAGDDFVGKSDPQKHRNCRGDSFDAAVVTNVTQNPITQRT
jgi:hypothetical protein